MVREQRAFSTLPIGSSHGTEILPRILHSPLISLIIGFLLFLVGILYKVKIRKSNLIHCQKSNQMNKLHKHKVDIIYRDYQFIVHKKCCEKLSPAKILKFARKKFGIRSDISLTIIDELTNTCILKSVSVDRDYKFHIVANNKFGGSPTHPPTTAQPAITSSRSENKSAHTTTFSILMSNISGGLKSGLSMSSKEIAIKAASFNDTLLSLSECNCFEHDATMLAESFGTDCKISSLDQVAYKKGERVTPAGTFKKNAYGSCIISKEKNIVEFQDINFMNMKFELVAAIISKGGIYGLKIGGYRSPSMTKEHEIHQFYSEIGKIIDKAKSKYELDYIIFAMDDNKTSSNIAKQCQKDILIDKFNLQNLIGEQPTRFGRVKKKNSHSSAAQNPTQPDSVLSWYNPMKCTVRAEVISKLDRSMDHCAIRISVDLCGVVPRKPEYRTVVRNVRVKSDEQIEERLEKEISRFMTVHDQDENIDDNLVDTVTEEFFKMIKDIKDWGWKKQNVKIPDTVSDKADKWTVRIQQEHAKMQKISYQLKTNPKCKEMLRKFKECQEKCLTYIDDKRNAEMDRDLKYCNDPFGVNLTKFYKWSDTCFSKRAFKNKIDKQISQKEKEERLLKHDETFINRDPNFVCNMENMVDTPFDRKFTIDNWDPKNDEDKLGEFIRSRKKVDRFYKEHAKSFAKPLFLILQLISLADYFPKSMRTSKATFIPGPRTIFSLESITKIIEGVLCIEFNECKEQDYKINGDPGGFAYRKNKGVVSCLGIALSEIERQPKQDRLGVVMVFCDLKKAFNSACRATIVKMAQKVCGAGRIIWTRFCNRTYTFEGKVRGGKENRGVDAGTPISVFGFDSFINSDESTTAANDGLLTHPNYSDDRNITASGTYVQNGHFQRDISCINNRSCDSNECQREQEMSSGKKLGPCAYCWCKREGVEFHEDGKKAPQSMIFCPKIAGSRVAIPSGGDKLFLGRTPIEVVSRQKVLGLNLANSPKADLFSSQSSQKSFVNQANKLIDNFGYYLEPNIDTYKSCAYRFQHLRDKECPERLALAVSSYFIGKLRFCAAFYYLRSTQKQLDTIRFYYGMALSAVLGLTAYETLGAACCKNTSVSEGNESFKKLLKITGLPSLKQLAIVDAMTFIKQTWLSKRHMLLPEGERLKEKEIERYEKLKDKKKVNQFFPKFCARKYENTLVHDCWKLVKSSKGNNDIQERQSDSTDSITISKHKKKKGIKMYQRFWQLANERVQNRKDIKVKHRLVREVFRVQVLAEIQALEMSDRQYSHKTPTKQIKLDKRCTVSPPEWPSSKKAPTPQSVEFNCSSLAPQLYMSSVQKKAAKNNIFPCLICGDFVKTNKSLNCNLCGHPSRIVHVRCANMCNFDKRNFECNFINQHLVPDELGGETVSRGVALDPIEKDPGSMCLICGSEFDGNIPQDIVRCKFNSDPKNPCNFKCHTKCVEAHNTIGEKKINTNQFKCSDIEYQFRPSFINTILSRSSNLDKNKSYLRSKNKVKPPINPRKRRYSDSTSKCYLCHEKIPLAQKNHLLQHCPAILSPPAVLGEIRDYGKFSTRCLEIAEKRLKLTENDATCRDESTSPTIEIQPEWGQRDGESITEANTRRKRQRREN